MEDLKKLNLSAVITQLDGEPLKNKENDLTVGDALASILVLDPKSKDPLRSYLLAKKLTENEGEIELNKTEVAFLKEVVEASMAFITLVKGQLLDKLS